MSKSELELIFSAYNHTELHQLCQVRGIRIAHTATRETMVRLLSGAETADIESYSEMDEWRHGIMGFVLDHWDALSTQLTCPAKSGDPKACFGCVDARVQYCLNQNEKYLHQIRIHKKKEEIQDMSDASSYTLENCPRTAEGVSSMSFPAMRRILDELAAAKHGFKTPTAKQEFFSTPMGPARNERFVDLLKAYDEATSGKGGSKSEGEDDEEQEPVAKATKARKTKTAEEKAIEASAGRPDVSGATGATQVVDLHPVLEELRKVQANQAEITKQIGQLHATVNTIGAIAELIGVLSAKSAAAALETEADVLLQTLPPKEIAELVGELRKLTGGSSNKGKG